MATLIALIILFSSWLLLSIRKGWYSYGRDRYESNKILSGVVGACLLVSSLVIPVRGEQEIELENPEFVIILKDKYFVVGKSSASGAPILERAGANDKRAFVAQEKSLFGVNVSKTYSFAP